MVAPLDGYQKCTLYALQSLAASSPPIDLTCSNSVHLNVREVHSFTLGNVPSPWLQVINSSYRLKFDTLGQTNIQICIELMVTEKENRLGCFSGVRKGSLDFKSWNCCNRMLQAGNSADIHIRSTFIWSRQGYTLCDITSFMFYVYILQARLWPMDQVTWLFGDLRDLDSCSFHRQFDSGLHVVSGTEVMQLVPVWF